MNTRYGSARQPHLVGAGLIAIAMGVYHLAIQSGSLSTLPRAENTESAYESVGLDGTPQIDIQQTELTPGVSNENPDFDILPPSESMVAYRNDREPTSRGDFEPPWEFGRNEHAASENDIHVFFSPKGGCTAAIVDELNRAQHQIMVQAYSFTSEPIAAACVAAHNRGVQVSAVLDKSQESEQYSAADFLVNSGVPTLIDKQHAIAHNKVILIDGKTLITGSFNFTSNAEQSNAENLLIIRNHPALYSEYEKNIQHHSEHSQKHIPRASANHSASQGHTHSKSR